MFTESEKKFTKHLKNKDFIWSLFSSLIFLIFSLAVSYSAIIYATKKQGSFVEDIILSNTPAYNVANVFVYGMIAVIIFVIYVIMTKPESIPFVAKSIAIFYLIRSFFMNLTHLGPYPDIIVTNTNVLNKLTSGGDLFFSGHTGFPFLLALIFWKEKKLRYTFLALSVLFGSISLLGHYHYTIDVLAAFFITYGIYHISIKLFKKDYQMYG